MSDGRRANYPTRPWSRAETRRLGTMSDEALGREIGRTAADVVAERRRRGITSMTGVPPAATPTLRGTRAELWAIYQRALGGPLRLMPGVLGYLAARGWSPTAAELMRRTDVTRPSAYRHVAMLRDIMALIETNQ